SCRRCDGGTRLDGRRVENSSPERDRFGQSNLHTSPAMGAAWARPVERDWLISAGDVVGDPEMGNPVDTPGRQAQLSVSYGTHLHRRTNAPGSNPVELRRARVQTRPTPR